MNNYCSNCGHALKPEDRVCPECNYQIYSHKTFKRRLEISKATKHNFILGLALSLTLIFVIGAAAGINAYSYSSGSWISTYVDPTTFIMGWILLFFLFPYAVYVLVQNRIDFHLNKVSSNEYLLTIFLFTVYIFSWIPYIVIWVWGNW